MFISLRSESPLRSSFSSSSDNVPVTGDTNEYRLLAGTQAIRVREIDARTPDLEPGAEMEEERKQKRVTF